MGDRRALIGATIVLATRDVALLTKDLQLNITRPSKTMSKIIARFATTISLAILEYEIQRSFARLRGWWCYLQREVPPTSNAKNVWLMLVDGRVGDYGKVMFFSTRALIEGLV